MATLPKRPEFSPIRRRVLILLVIGLASLIGLDFFAAHHPYFGIDGTPGFAAWYGFAAALLAVALALGWARIVGRKGDRADD